MGRSSGIALLINEEFYVRIGSNLLTAIILNFPTPDKCEIEIVSGGGKQGVVLQLDWGAEWPSLLACTDSWRKTAAAEPRAVLRTNRRRGA